MSDLTAAASVLLSRGPSPSELFIVRRAETLRAFGGFHAFPGGKVCPDDTALAAHLANSDPQSVARVAAVRELFEETGVLLARLPDGSFPAADAELAHFRKEMLANRFNFRDLLAQRGLIIHAADLRYAGSLVTPPFSSVRFDTAFFIASMPPRQTATVWPGELADGGWRSADDVLQSWAKGEILVSPPTVSLLELIRGRAVAHLPELLRPVLESLAQGAIPPIWFAPHVRMLPLFCQGLPPSTHTNAFLVGAERIHLFDPGPSDPAEQQRLFDVLDRLPAEGRRLHAIVLTHHHPDHIGAVNACAQRYGVPVLAHPVTAQLLQGKIAVQQMLHDGGKLDLGGGWIFEAIFTPGHAPGHLAFYDPRYRLLFVGDMVSTLSSVVIAPPEGNLAVYLHSLRRLQAYPARLLLPAHGFPSARPGFTLAECLEHRLLREEQLLTALGDQPRSVSELAVAMYRGLPAKMMRFAEMQILAGLLKLKDEGRVNAALDGTTWLRVG